MFMIKLSITQDSPKCTFSLNNKTSTNMEQSEVLCDKKKHGHMLKFAQQYIYPGVKTVTALV